MQKIMTPRLIPALLAIAFAGGAHASGFQLMGEQSASGLGNAGAGSAAVAENASTIYYNPAGMTQLQAREISAGLAAVKTGFKFTNDGSVTPGFSGNSDGGTWGFVPNAYGSWAVTKDIYLGLGIGAPFGLAVEYDSPWQGSAHSNSFEIKTININPSIAWRANEWLSLGAGINYQMIDAEYKRNVAVAASPRVTNCAAVAPTSPLFPAAVPCQSKAKLTMDDAAWGWNIGALFTPAAQTKIGMSYRSSIKYKAEGDVKVTGPSATVNAGGSSDIEADIELPDTFILSLSQGIGTQWELLADVSWTGWSSIPKVDINRTSGPLAANPATKTAQTLDTAFDDAWRFAVGANYKMNDAWKLRFGIAYDQTPVPDAEHRLTSLPDNDRTWFSAGFQYKPAKNMAVDVGAAYIYLGDTEINNDERTTNPSTNKGLVKGDYDNYSFILGGQFSMSF
jgi:long-chain fatty acid transport protein